jgi:hypothetical protein
MNEKYRPKAFAEVKGGASKIQSVDWWTPPEIFQKLGIEFDIDVASPIGGVDWIPAKKYFTEQDDGLIQDWEGTVWMNPPYGKFTANWLEKFVNHKDGIALVFARTDTLWFHNFAAKADALLFTKGRLAFYRSGKKGQNAASGSLLIACGEKSVNALEQSGLGWFVKL